MPNISVVVPVYNVEKYLSECLDSLVNQTLKDIEIVCVNDGSTDNSLDILNSYAEKDSRIRIISTENHGYGHAMNTGFGAATGDYIGILESDDFTASNMYEELYKTAVANDADIVKSNYWNYRGGKKELARSLKDGPYDKVFSPRHDTIQIFSYTPSIWSAIYRREFIVENGIRFNETPGASFQDTSFNFMVLSCADRVVLKKDAYICYRRDNESSSVNSLKKVYCVFDEYKYSNDFLVSRGEKTADLKYLLPALAWSTYSWNYGRISAPFKYEFLERVINNFDAFWNKGEIKPKYWLNKEHLKECTHVLADKNCFLHRVYMGFQKREALLGYLKNKVHDHSRVYVYGAGIVGQEIAGMLEKHELSFNGFAVTSRDCSARELMGKEIVSLTEIDNMGCGNDIMFILSVKEATQPEILSMLRERGYRDVIVMTNEMRKYLVKFEGYDIHGLVCGLL
ncbi:glycosyltransferase family 2 protein [Anaerovibrio lipolyticus]|uniref:glycosyltransferase family 2 protein n=1 Tax=Anaerovibrio lipolyticus TaxID=82374 RepID=UPI00069220EC|nr:glycosyltransferase [Anaerovibrio lipolyticus]